MKIGENNLADIDEPDVGSIVDNLRRRYLNNAFYTYIGDVLIYMPPFSGTWIVEWVKIVIKFVQND